MNNLMSMHLFLFGLLIGQCLALLGVDLSPLTAGNNLTVSFHPEHFKNVQIGAPWGSAAISNQTWIDPSGRKTYSYWSYHADVWIYVMDSGIQLDHKELRGRAFSLVSPLPKQSGRSHGTQMATIAAGGSFGVARGAYVVDAFTVNDDGEMFDFTPAAMLRVVCRDIQRNGRLNSSVILMAFELHGEKAMEDMRVAIGTAADLGIPIVAGMGNRGVEYGSYPATDDRVMAVAGSNSRYEPGDHSNYGADTDMWAPGELIWAGIPGSDYRLVSGSSPASAMVAGVMAYLLGVEGPRNARDLYNRVYQLSSRGLLHGDLGDSPNRFIYNGVDYKG